MEAAEWTEFFRLLAKVYEQDIELILEKAEAEGASDTLADFADDIFQTLETVDEE